MPHKVSTRSLAMELTRVTEAAALASSRWLGLGRKEQGDGAAVDAMRAHFDTLDINGTIVIGEGEKDKAPMLFNGENLGSGKGPEVDIAVDPVEGTRLLALGRPNAIAVVSMAPRGSMYNPGPGFYMKKLVVPREAKGKVHISDPVPVILSTVAESLHKNIRDLVVFVLDKKRHEQLIEDIRSAGARIQLHTDGDVAGALMAVTPDTGIDIMMGTGGTPEGILAATAIRVAGGDMQGQLDPQSEEERDALLQAGFNLDRTLTLDEMVRSDDVLFAATGITGGSFLPGVAVTGKGVRTSSVVFNGANGTIRRIDSQYVSGIMTDYVS